MAKSTRSVRELLSWYRTRAAAMSLREIGHRFGEAAAKQSSRFSPRIWDAVKVGGPLVSLPGIAKCILKCQPDLAATIVREAKDVGAGRFNLLGAQWPNPGAMPPPPAFWHTDPDDGTLFPRWNAYCFDISFRHGVNIREVKRIWELNRLQFLVPLSVCGTLSGGSSDFELVLGILRSWMEGNPPFQGLNWVTGIELALRVISVGLSLSIVGVDRLDEVTRQQVLRFFFTHIDWLRRFPSLHSSANNHRIAELSGIIVATTMAPGILGGETLREASWHDLLAELDRQICADGVGAEQAPAYTAFAIELFLIAAIAHSKEQDLPAPTKKRLAAWAEQTLWFMDTDARMPAIGDWDDGRVIATTQAYEPRYIASVVSAVAKRVGRPDLAPPAKDPSIRELLLGSAAPISVARTGLRLFPEGGYSVIRSKGESPAVLIFDHGPVGYLSIAAHGHADTLAVWLSVGNQPILVDAGTHKYHSDRVIRDAFRSTIAHNTLTLCGVGSSRPAGPFNWASKAKARCVVVQDGPIARLVAEHDGFLARFGLRHRRTIEFDGASQIVITDELLGDGDTGEVTISFLLNPACEARLDGRSFHVSAGGRSIARLVSTGPLSASITRGDTHSNLGWVSPSFGVLLPASCLLFQGKLEQPSVITINLLSETQAQH